MCSTRVRGIPGEKIVTEMGTKSYSPEFSIVPSHFAIAQPRGLRGWAELGPPLTGEGRAAFPLWAAVIIPFPSGRPPAFCSSADDDGSDDTRRITRMQHEMQMLCGWLTAQPLLAAPCWLVCYDDTSQACVHVTVTPKYTVWQFGGKTMLCLVPCVERNWE